MATCWYTEGETRTVRTTQVREHTCTTTCKTQYTNASWHAKPTHPALTPYRRPTPSRHPESTACHLLFVLAIKGLQQGYARNRPGPGPQWVQHLRTDCYVQPWRRPGAPVGRSAWTGMGDLLYLCQGLSSRTCVVHASPCPRHCTLHTRHPTARL